MRFTARNIAIITSFICFISTAFQTNAQNSEAISDLSKSFRKVELVRIASSSTEGFAGNERKLRFALDGRTVELSVVEHDLRAPGYKAENTGPQGETSAGETPVTTFKGYVAGEPRSHVRLSIRDSKIEGYFQLDGEHLFIEPASKYSEKASKFDSVIYRAEDSLIDSSFACLADVPTRIKAGDRMVAGENANLLQSLRRFNIATEADREWVNTFGSPEAANLEILSIINMVEGTYVSELGLQVRVTYQHTWTTNDPYASSTGASGVLLNFRNHWNLNYPTVAYPRNAAHLFTAKSNAQSQGVAYIGVICQNAGASYGLTGFVGWAPGKYLVPAHELGHNLGGQHAEAAQSCGSTLMNAQLSGTTPMSFCLYSQSQITSYIAASGFCMLPVAAASKRFDFDGDSRADLAIWRPSDGNWWIKRSDGTDNVRQWGISTDRPVPADYDADGKTDMAVYRDGQWWRWMSTTNTFRLDQWGLADDIPAPADFDGDGRVDIAVYRPQFGQWYWIRSSDGQWQMTTFGVAGDIPLPADFDADGRADISVYRPQGGTWWRINSSNGQWSVRQWGNATDKPVLGDFDADGRTDIAVFRPDESVWYIIGSQLGDIRTYQFGNPEDVPSVGDFDGDGRTDISLFRPSEGVWYRLNYTNGSYTAAQYGSPGDIPIPSYYVR